MSTTQKTPTIPELRAQLAEAEREIAECEREIGAATLDGTSTTKLRQTRDAARESVAELQAAIAEVERRAAASQAEDRRVKETRERAKAYPRLAEHFRLAEQAVRAQRDAAEALAEFEAAKLPDAARQAKRTARMVVGKTAPSLLDESLCSELVVTRHEQERMRPDHRYPYPVGHFDDLAKQAAALAAEARQELGDRGGS